MSRKVLFNSFIFALLGCMLYLAGRLLYPSLGPLLIAIVLAIIFDPVHVWLARRIRQTSLCALASTLLVFSMFVVPLGFLLWTATAELHAGVPAIRGGVEHLSGWIRTIPELVAAWRGRLPPWLAEWLMVEPTTVQDGLQNFAERWAGSLVHFGSDVVRNAAGILFKLVLLLIALFFFFRDGRSLWTRVNQLLPLRADAKKRLEQRIKETVSGVVRGNFLIILAHGLVGAVGLLIVRAESVILLGLLMALAAAIPAVGTALVWGPLSVHYLMEGSYFRGLFLIGWGILAIGPIDNILRPWVVSAKTKIPFFWLMFGVIGGVQVFGPTGLLLGPLIMAVIPVLLDIYEESVLHDLHSTS
jgi:predicted PurR-regulated permease PerM